MSKPSYVPVAATRWRRCWVHVSYAGKVALNRLPERIFPITLKTILTIFGGGEKFVMLRHHERIFTN
jgi:hypothetical protein